MIDKKIIFGQTDLIRDNLSKRKMDGKVDLARILELEVQRKDLQKICDETRASINRMAKERNPETAEAARGLRESVKETEARLEAVIKEQDQLMMWVPNLLDERVPVGDESANQVIRSVGGIPSFDFKIKSHDEIGVDLGMIDFDRGVKISGSRAYFMKNEAVQMRYALVRMFGDRLIKDGFQLVSPPLMVKKETLYGTGYLPFAQKENFTLSDTDLTLIGTSEQPMVTQHMGEMLPAENLPLCYLGESQCFRTEIGSHGKDTKGLLRVHQFFKTEQIVFCHPQASEEWHQKTLENEEWILKQLGIPYQVVLTSSEDLAPFGSIKYDIEAWIPSQNKYREMTSNTNLLDYQTRRSNIRAKEKGGNKFFPHTISATGFSDRLIIAILENYQQADGSVAIPEALRPYLGFDSIKKRKNAAKP